MPQQAALALLDTQTSRSVLECDPRPSALQPSQTQEGHPGRFLVRVTSFRRRLLDEDNLCEKYVVDCCRYAGLLPADDAGAAKIEVSQVQVRRKEEERTEVLIEGPNTANHARSPNHENTE